MAKKLNGTLKTAGIVVGIVLAVGSIVWAVAIRSDNLDDLIRDVAENKEECEKVEVRVDTVEDAVIKIETKMEHMITMQGQILDEIRK